MPEPNANTAEAESVRYCNVKKVVNVVRAKRANAKLGGQFFRFIGFFVLYVILVWGQRNGYNAYSITSAMREYLAEQVIFSQPQTMFRRAHAVLCTGLTCRLAALPGSFVIGAQKLVRHGDGG